MPESPKWLFNRAGKFQIPNFDKLAKSPKLRHACEDRQVNMQLKRSLKKSVSAILQNKSTQSTIEISHA